MMSSFCFVTTTEFAMLRILYAAFLLRPQTLFVLYRYRHDDDVMSPAHLLLHFRFRLYRPTSIYALPDGIEELNVSALSEVKDNDLTLSLYRPMTVLPSQR
jgi:hypothetical protein